MSAEDPSASRTRMASPSHQRNGHEDRAGSVSRTEERSGSTRHPDHLNTGPASRAAKGSSSSMPFADCSDVDSEYNQAIRLDHSYREQHDRMRYRESPTSSKQLLNMSHELDESPNQSYQKVDQSPVHSSIVDLSAHNRDRHCSSPLTVPNMGSRSGVISPAMDNHQPTLGYAEQNGFNSAPPNSEEGRYSPFPSRSSRLQKLHKVRHLSETDPNQGASSPGHESRPVLSRAERMAALERRMVANGLSVSGRSRASAGRKRLGQTGVTHVGPVHMNDCSTTSGSESSESEVETNRENCSSPLTAGNPVEANSNSPLPRNKFSFGSLQLDEEADEDGCNAFSDEDGAQIFNC